MSNISSQHDPLLKQNRDTGAGQTPPRFDLPKGTIPWAQSYEVIPQAVLPAFWLLPWPISQHTHLCLIAQKPLTTPLQWSYYSTSIFLCNFQICQPKIKEQIIPFIIRWKTKLFWGKYSHWWSFPLKSLISVWSQQVLLKKDSKTKQSFIFNTHKNQTWRAWRCERH